jgi:molecular chaperone GrpE (heat shock protein)
LARGIEEQMTPEAEQGAIDQEATGQEDTGREDTGRGEIIRRFETLLDSVLAGEDPPAGIDAGILQSVLNDRDSLDSAGDSAGARGCDSYTLWTAMTALTQEIKLQGRAFQELNRSMAAQPEKIADELRAIYADRENAQRRETERRCRREVLGALIDLRDRLGRGRESVRAREAEITAAKRAGWFSRLSSAIFSNRAAGASADAVGAMIRGYELGIERLDQTLNEFNASEIRCEGEGFDPRLMNAIDSEESSAVDPDTVLEVYRSGYEWEGDVFRPAQVKVSRPPAVVSEK